jgi:hypothetical protein
MGQLVISKSTPQPMMSADFNYFAAEIKGTVSRDEYFFKVKTF